MGPATSTLVFCCFAGARFGLISPNVSPVVLIFGPVLVAVLLSIPGLFAAMFRNVPGLVFRVSLSRSSPESLCAGALAVLRAGTLGVLLALVE